MSEIIPGKPCADGALPVLTADTGDFWTARMLSGEPFTYGGLCAARHATFGVSNDPDRLLDRTIQKLRRRGLIQCARDGRAVRWTLADGVSQDATKANSGMNP